MIQLLPSGAQHTQDMTHFDTDPATLRTERLIDQENAEAIIDSLVYGEASPWALDGLANLLACGTPVGYLQSSLFCDLDLLDYLDAGHGDLIAALRVALANSDLSGLHGLGYSQEA